MYEACKYTCHKITSKDEVENDKEDIVVEKILLIMKKEMKNMKIYREKTKQKNNNTIIVHNE